MDTELIELSSRDQAATEGGRGHNVAFHFAWAQLLQLYEMIKWL